MKFTKYFLSVLVSLILSINIAIAEKLFDFFGIWYLDVADLLKYKLTKPLQLTK